MRLTRHAIYMTMAHTVAQRSTCPRGRVGAVLVADRGVIVYGYSGAPKGLPHCDDAGCDVAKLVTTASPIAGTEVIDTVEHCIRTVHAEINAILAAARKGVSTEGARLYCTHAPCKACALMLINAGVAEVHYCHEYHASGLDLLHQGGVTVWKSKTEMVVGQ